MKLQLGKVPQQFGFARQPAEVEADHLVRAQRRLAAGPQADQEAGDDRAVRLNLDAILVGRTEGGQSRLVPPLSSPPARSAS